MIRLMIPFLFFIFCLSSCDPGSSYSHTVDNKSSHNLLVKIIRGGIVEDSIAIEAHKREIIFSAGGHVLSQNYSCTNYFGTIEVDVVGNTLLKVKKDVNNESSWSATTKRDPFGGGFWNCLLTINDSDIQ